MKTQIILTLLIAIMAFTATHAIAQETEEHVRAEYLLCSLKDGFTFQDVINNAKEYGEIVAADGSKYNQYLLRPMMIGERFEGITHILLGVWPDGKELYKEYGNYVNKHMDEREVNSPHTCRVTYATMDRVVINDFRENETTDQRWPFQLSNCTLNEGKTIDDVISVQKDAHQTAITNGMRGYGAHFQVPYLGFQDVEYDFLSAVWWQSFEHRGNMALNYYKVAERHSQQMDAVASCKDDRAYFAEVLFTTWE